MDITIIALILIVLYWDKSSKDMDTLVRLYVNIEFFSSALWPETYAIEEERKLW